MVKSRGGRIRARCIGGVEGTVYGKARGCVRQTIDGNEFDIRKVSDVIGAAVTFILIARRVESQHRNCMY